MEEWAQIIDAQESANDGVKTRMTLWSLDRQARFTLEVPGVTPFDIGHILLVEHQDGQFHGLRVLQFESLSTKLRDRLLIDPVSFTPKEQRPFQVQSDWRELARRDRDYRKKLEDLARSTYDIEEGARLYRWGDTTSSERLVV